MKNDPEKSFHLFVNNKNDPYNVTIDVSLVNIWSISGGPKGYGF